MNEEIQSRKNQNAWIFLALFSAEFSHTLLESQKKSLLIVFNQILEHCDLITFMTMDCHNSINIQSWNKNIILVALNSLVGSDISKMISTMMIHVQVSKLRYSLSLIIWSKMVCIPNAFWLKYFSIILASNIPKMVIMALMKYKKITSLIILSICSI